MRRLWLIAPLCVVGFLGSGLLVGQDKEPSGKRVQLPPYYSKLGMTTKQRNEVRDICRKYDAEIQELQQKVNDLKDRKLSDCANVLTAKQKTRLKELILGSEKNTGINNKKKETDAKGKNAPEEFRKPVDIKK